MNSAYHSERLVLTQLQPLVIWLEQHQIAMAERCRSDFDKKFVWFDLRNLMS